MNHNKFLEVASNTQAILRCNVSKIIDNANKYDENDKDNTYVFCELSHTYREKLCCEILAMNNIGYEHYSKISSTVDKL